MSENTAEKRCRLSDSDFEELGRMIETLQPPQYTAEEILARFSMPIHNRLMAGVRIKDIIRVLAAKGFKVTREQVESAAADAAARKLAYRKPGRKPARPPEPSAGPRPQPPQPSPEPV